MFHLHETPAVAYERLLCALRTRGSLFLPGGAGIQPGATLSKHSSEWFWRGAANSLACGDRRCRIKRLGKHGLWQAQGAIQHHLSRRVYVRHREITHQAMGLRPPSVAVAGGEYRAVWEGVVFAGAVAKRKPMGQPYLTHRSMKTQPTQPPRHELGNSGGHVECARHVAVEKDAIVYLARGRAAERDCAGQGAGQFVRGPPYIVQRVRVLLLGHNHTGACMTLVQFDQVKFDSCEDLQAFSEPVQVDEGRDDNRERLNRAIWLPQGIPGGLHESIKAR